MTRRTTGLVTHTGLVLVAAACVWSALTTRTWRFELREDETIYLPQVTAELTPGGFATEHHAGTPLPRMHSAVLAFDDDRVLLYPVSVGRPAQYRGHRFHLSGFRSEDGATLLTLTVRRIPAWPLLPVSLLVALFGIAMTVLFHGLPARDGPPAARRRPRTSRLVLKSAAAVVFLVSVVLVVVRTLAAGHLPIAGMHEALLFFSCAVGAYLVFTRDFGLPGLLVAAGLLAAALLLPDRLTASRPLAPALQNAWFTPHVGFAFLAYGGIIAAALSPRRHRALPVAFLCLTLALVAGIVWAEDAWASFWSWDPKETWTLVTWLLLAGAMHMRFLGHRRLERLAAFLALAAVVYNFVVVNLVLPGLHGYH